MQYPTQYGNYTLLESIGEGGMSEIDLAQATVADAQYIRFLVIKRIRDQLVEEESHIRMFQDEARICAELQHANIAQVYDFGRINDEFFIAMEYIPGVDLRQLQKALARQRKGIPFRITLRILHDVLSALHYAHYRVDTFGQPMHIVHRDVNPRNVMLSVRGEVKLIDFGVAKSTAKQDQTVGHIIKGKFAYMSPEQIEGGNIDGRADLFALGLMLHEMVEGSRPFHGLSEIQIMHRIISGSIPKLTGPTDYAKPELIHEIHQKVLSVDQDERYKDAKEMQQALIEAATHCNGMASPQELAAFLAENMPQRTQAISDRLHNYRQDITGSISRPASSIGIKTNSDAPSVSQETTTKMDRENSSKLTVVMAGMTILAIGIFLVMLSKKEEPITLQPTQVQTREQPRSSKEQDTEKRKSENTDLSNNDSKPSSVVIPQKTISAPVKETPKKENPIQSTEPKQPKPEKTTASVQKSPTKSVAAKETEKITPVEKQTISEEKTITLPKDPQKTAVEDISPKEKTPPAEPITEKPAESIKIFLGVGVASGTKGLPVRVDGKQVTRTGSQKRISLTIGKHIVEVEDPKTGVKVRKEIEITKTDSQKIIGIEGL